MSLVDTAFVGRLGAEALGALGVNAGLFGLAFFAFNFLAYGVTPRVARALGRGDAAGAARTAGQALWLGLGLGLVVLALLQAFAEPLLALLGADGALREPSLTYLRIRALAAPAVLLITAGNGVFRGLQDTRTPLVVTLGLNVVNLILDPLLIFGLGWGIAGAAWATTAAQWMGALTFVALLARPRAGGTRRIARRLPRFHEVVPLLRVGMALTVRTVAVTGTMLLATAVAARLGVEAVAAHQVAAQLWLLLALVVDALAVAGQALVAKHVGAAQPRRARQVADRLLAWGLVVGLLLMAGFAALSGLLPRLFTDEAAVLAKVALIFPFVAAMQPLNALVFVWDGVYLGREAFRFMAWTTVLAGLAAAAVLLATLPLGWGLEGVWWGLVTLMIARGLLLGVPYALRRGPWRVA